MSNSFRLFALVFLSALLPTSPNLLHAQSSTAAAVPHSFGVADGHFVLDGKPIQIISGEMHTPRIPRAEWRNKLRLAHAMGLNAITVYVFWNDHELTPGHFDFSDQRDVAEFVRMAQQEGLYVILRPGPYVCAEWEWGGYPAWLLKDPSTVVRSNDEKFLAPARNWLKRLGEELAPLQIGNGGPIIAVQIENEYGSFGDDMSYKTAIRQALIDAGFTKAQLYTADGADVLAKGSFPDLPAVINFGVGDAKRSFDLLKKARPQGPFMSGEYWAGWFDHWGEAHHTTDARVQADELAWMLKQGYSVSIYMFQGGTSFGWMNGANIDHGKYQPDVTSYDYDAPLDESGRPAAKYALFREAIAQTTGRDLPPVPSVEPLITLPEFKLSASTPLMSNLPQPVQSEKTRTMEELDQAYGYILYRTTLNGPVKGELELDQLHDYARIYANGKLIGALDRRLEQNKLPIELAAATTQLDILVENSGRVNYSIELRGESKGITKEVRLNGKALTGWQIYNLPMNDPAKLDFKTDACTGPCFARGSFNLTKTGDSYLDTSKLGKGFVWINGHELGRFWQVGPQRALFVPASWLNAGSNEVIIFDLDHNPGATLRGLNHPLLDEPQPEKK